MSQYLDQEVVFHQTKRLSLVASGVNFNYSANSRANQFDNVASDCIRCQVGEAYGLDQQRRGYWIKLPEGFATSDTQIAIKVIPQKRLSCHSGPCIKVDIPSQVQPDHSIMVNSISTAFDLIFPPFHVTAKMSFIMKTFLGFVGYCVICGV